MFNTDKSMIPFMITVTLMTVIFIFGLIVFLITFQKKQNRKNKEYLQALIAEKDRTMYLISLEVHDNVNQMLNMVRMNLHWLAKNPLNENETLLHDTGEMIDTLIMDTNNISHTLNTEYLEKKGLISSLKEEVAWVNNSKKIRCNINISGITKKFEPQTEVMVFRIAQEAVQNVIKHAEADCIEITLRYEPGIFEMSVRDNGRGFDPGQHHYSGSVGMQSMSRRAMIVEGKLKIDSSLGKGTNVMLQIPYTDKNVTVS